ncbi:hypothetical protein RCL1_004399 [Eukaryota sp. TZLM3-RCL]
MAPSTRRHRKSSQSSHEPPCKKSHVSEDVSDPLPSVSEIPTDNVSQLPPTTTHKSFKNKLSLLATCTDLPTSSSSSFWTDEFGLHLSISLTLAKLGITNPNEVQKATIPKILSGLNVALAAETGSGKTFCFALPIVHFLLTKSFSKKEGPSFLILTPSRELAVQIYEVFEVLLDDYAELKRSVVLITGGLAYQKQVKKLDKYRPTVVIATPGRINDLINNDLSTFLTVESLLNSLEQVVIDEADRVIDGHLIDCMSSIMSQIDCSRVKFGLFSATLTNQANQSVISDLLKKLKLNSSTVKFDILDLRTSSVVSTVKELKMTVLNNQKDYYLYYLLTVLTQLHATNHVIIFVNSVELVKRLSSLFSLLFPSFNVVSLHANKQQKQRLKALEVFSKSKVPVILVTSDVASRGLDLPIVDLVVHYSVPRHSDLYVHRSGRTGRAGSTGLSIILIAPDDVPSLNKLSTSLDKNLSQLGDVRSELFSTQSNSTFLIDHLKSRFNLAQSIEKLSHKLQSNKLDSRGHVARLAIEAGLLEQNDNEKEIRNIKKQITRLQEQLSGLSESVEQVIFSNPRKGKFLVISHDDLN